MTTRINKGRNGWQAETHVPLFGDKLLVIHTRKGSNGLYTSITGQKLDRGFLVWELFGDYSKRIDHPERCTEKAVRTLHEQALATKDALIADATAHYAAKVAA